VYRCGRFPTFVYLEGTQSQGHAVAVKVARYRLAALTKVCACLKVSVAFVKR